MYHLTRERMLRKLVVVGATALRPNGYRLLEVHAFAEVCTKQFHFTSDECNDLVKRIIQYGVMNDGRYVHTND